MNHNQTEGEYLLPPGTILNNGCYRIIRKLGQGGFGITYLADQLGWLENIGDGQTKFRKGKPEIVVIKELFYQEFCSRESGTQIVTISRLDKKVEFQKLVNKQVEEGRILRQLDHANIVINRKIFEEKGTAYIVMDYIIGSDLEEVLKQEGSLNPDRAIKYTVQILLALSHIHSRKIAHLDIKPSNIYIRKERLVEKEDGNLEKMTDDSAVLIDFGASLTYGDNDHIKSTTSKLVSGISSYAALEQNDINHLKEFDPSLDTFSLAGTLYHCLTGVMPSLPSLRVSGRSVLQLPSTFQMPEVLSRQFDEIVDKGLKIKSSERFHSAEEFLQACMVIKEAVYVFHFQAAMEMVTRYERNNETTELLAEALKEFKLANQAVPGKEECLERITEYETEIAENIELHHLKKFEKLFAAANDLASKGDLEEALTQLTTALKLYPANAPAIELLKKLNEQIALAGKKQQFTALINKTKQSIQAQQWQSAMESINTALNIFPDETNAQALLETIKQENEKTKIVIPDQQPDSDEREIKPLKPDERNTTKLKNFFRNKTKNITGLVPVSLGIIWIIFNRYQSSNEKIDPDPFRTFPITSVIKPKKSLSPVQAEYLVKALDSTLRRGEANQDSLTMVIKDYPAYKQEIVTSITKKAEYSPYLRDIAYALVICDTTKIELSDDLRSIILNGSVERYNNAIKLIKTEKELGF